METMIDMLTTLVERGIGEGAPRARHGDTGKGPSTARTVGVDLSAAPACVKRLAEAMARTYYNVRIGKLSMYETGASDEVQSLEATLDSACERGGISPQWVTDKGGPSGSGFDPARTIELGTDGGGMSMLGVTWSGATLGLVVVEHEDPVEDNLLAHFATPQGFFDFLDELKDDGDEDHPDLTALKAAAKA